MRAAHRPPRTPRQHLANHLAPFTVRLDLEGRGTDARGVLGLDNPVADAMITTELTRLAWDSSELRGRIERLRVATDPPARQTAMAAVERTLDAALRRCPDLVDTLWPLLAPWIGAECAEHDRAAARLPRLLRGALSRGMVAALLAASIAAVLLIALWAADRRVGPLGVAELAVVAILSFLPGWLYVRFVGQRAGAVWDEYVLNLHRLGLDEPHHLPEPPMNSEYYRAWFDGGGALLSRHRNIYRQKFEAFYGRSASEVGPESRVRSDTLFPIVLATVTFAIGWTAVLWDGAFTEAPTSTLDILAFGFLGAYMFDIQMLARRYFQSDLKPSAYASAVLRVILVLIIVLVVHQLPLFTGGDGMQQEAVVAFVVGLFPLVGLQAINRVAAVILRGAVPTLRTRYPLSDLEGLNVWYEARLLEEGIEDMQNLVSANMVEVLLHTRVPVGRLIDWHDQAHLYLHLRPRPRRQKKGGPVTHPRDALESIGVRSATAFLQAFPIAAPGDTDDWSDRRATYALEALGRRSDELSGAEVITIARVLDAEPGLDPVRSWRSWKGPAAPEPPPVVLHAAA